jgi:hypothetical protein
VIKKTSIQWCVLRKTAPFILLVLSLFLTPSFLKAQSDSKYKLGFIPAAIAEVDVAFPIQEKWNLSGQVDLQLVTQGAYTNSNPYAYIQRFVIRPWLVYSGLKHMKLYVSYARNRKYEIEEAGNPEILEKRIIVMGTYMQTMPRGSLFEQVRFETKFFDDKDGIARTIPRLRGRFGVNHFLPHKENPIFKTHNLSYYTEIMFKFPSKDYAKSRFDIFRQSVYYSATVTDNLTVLTGIIAQMQLRTNGTQLDVYYGPTIALKWNFKPKVRETFDMISNDID